MGKTLEHENQREKYELQNVVVKSCEISFNLCFIHLKSSLLDHREQPQESALFLIP